MKSKFRQYVFILCGLLVFMSAILAPSAAEALNLVWTVAPTLEFTSAHYCPYCDLFNRYNFAQNISPSDFGAKLNELIRGGFFTFEGAGGTALSLCWGHGGGYSRFMYDERRGLFGFHYSDEGGHVFTMVPRHEFQLTVNRPVAFRRIDIDRVRAIVDEYGTRYYFDEAYVCDRYAIMYSGTFVTGFIYDGFDRNISHFGWNLPLDTIAVRLNNRWGVLDRSGNIVIPFVFDHITYIDQNVAFAKYNGRYGILDVRRTAGVPGSNGGTGTTPGSGSGGGGGCNAGFGLLALMLVLPLATAVRRRK